MTVYMTETDVLSSSLFKTLKAAGTTMFVAVPCVYGKMMSQLQNILAEKKGFALKFVKWARRVGTRATLSTQYKCKPKHPFGYFLANKFLFRQI